MASTRRSTQPPLHVVGGSQSTQYHTETVPCMRKISSDEVALFQDNPAKLVGNKFTPSHGEDVWEVLEVRFSKTGWSVQFEGSDEETHKMEVDDFVRMLKSGMVEVVEQE